MPKEQWSEGERWAWQEISAGRIVDFNQRDGNELDPKVPNDWNEGRKLRSDFLKEILFHEPYRRAILVEGVRITAAWFPDAVDLAHGRLDHQLWLDKCRFERAVDLTGLRVDDWVSLEGSAFAEQARDLTSVSLTSAKIDGSINMTGATVAGRLTMTDLQVGQSLLMSGPNAIFQDVELTGAKVGGVLSLGGATVTGRLTMNGLEVGQSLFKSGPNAAFRDVDLVAARVGGHVDMNRAMVAGSLNMNGLEVSKGLLMRGPGAAFQDVDLTGATVAGQVDMSAATVMEE
jgi:hypothetical protein